MCKLLSGIKFPSLARIFVSTAHFPEHFLIWMSHRNGDLFEMFMQIFDTQFLQVQLHLA